MKRYSPENAVSGVSRNIQNSSHLWQSKDMTDDKAFLSLLRNKETIYTKNSTNDNERLCITKMDVPVIADKVLIEIESIYGDKTAKIFEVRVY